MIELSILRMILFVKNTHLECTMPLPSYRVLSRGQGLKKCAKRINLPYLCRSEMNSPFLCSLKGLNGTNLEKYYNTKS